VRVDRALAAGFVFSAALHLVILVSWERDPSLPEKKMPTRMVARLITGGERAESASPEAETPEPETPPVEETAGPVLRSFRAGAAGGASAASPAVKVRPIPGLGRRSVSPAGGTAIASRGLPARAIFGAPPKVTGGAAVSSGDPLAEIRRRIESHKSYPGLARRKGWEGDVVVELQLDGGGEVRDVRVVEKSGHGVLDRATVATILKAGPYPPMPGRVRVPVSYRLTPE